jgi:hypothetical protein
MGIFSTLLSLSEEADKAKKKKDKSKLEREMSARDLEEWQKELVRKGDYDVYNFEEDDLEEDDYYYDDDK